MSLKIFAIGITLSSLFIPLHGNQFSDSRPAVKEAISPIYPGLAMNQKIQGQVIVVVEIDSDGVVTVARAIAGHKLLSVVAEETAKRWRFENADKGENGRTTKVSFTFKICDRKVPERERRPIFKPPYEIEICEVEPELIFTPSGNN
jgi:TonB family protein